MDRTPDITTGIQQLRDALATGSTRRIARKASHLDGYKKNLEYPRRNAAVHSGTKSRRPFLGHQTPCASTRRLPPRHPRPARADPDPIGQRKHHDDIVVAAAFAAGVPERHRHVHGEHRSRTPAIRTTARHWRSAARHSGLVARHFPPVQDLWHVREPDLIEQQRQEHRQCSCLSARASRMSMLFARDAGGFCG